MIGVGISIVMAETSSGTVAVVVGEGGVVPPPPPVEDRYILDGGMAATTAFSKTVDCGDAFTTIFGITYSGETAY